MLSKWDYWVKQHACEDDGQWVHLGRNEVGLMLQMVLYQNLREMPGSPLRCAR
jgi:hypothetical protein